MASDQSRLPGVVVCGIPDIARVVRSGRSLPLRRATGVSGGGLWLSQPGTEASGDDSFARPDFAALRDVVCSRRNRYRDESFAVIPTQFGTERCHGAVVGCRE